VLGTGWFAAVAAEVGPGKMVAVVGDGAVGLLAVLAAQQLGADRIIAMSRHEPRQKLAMDYGATDIVAERGDDGVARIEDCRSYARPARWISSDRPSLAARGWLGSRSGKCVRPRFQLVG
jgi:threonine dehydrogenase-like Zn-dependent dehydrogenase